MDTRGGLSCLWSVVAGDGTCGRMAEPKSAQHGGAYEQAGEQQLQLREPNLGQTQRPERAFKISRPGTSVRTPAPWQATAFEQLLTLLYFVYPPPALFVFPARLASLPFFSRQSVRAGLKNG